MHKAYIILFALFLLGINGYPQSKKDLQKKKAQLEKDIDYTNKLLSETQKSRSSTLNELVTLNKKISYRSELISTINTEITGVNVNINHVSKKIDSLESRLAVLKKNYAELLYFAYKNQTVFSKVSFIFSSDNVNQAFKRLTYLRELSNYRLRQREMILQLEDSLSGRKNELEDVKQTKSDLLDKQKKEVLNLNVEKKQQETVIVNLSAKEKKLRGDLKEKQKQAAKLNKMIEEVIRKEIEAARIAARKRAAATATASAVKKPVIPAASVLTATPEAQKLSADFESNRGRLPWPVAEGYVSSSFGLHAHAVWRDVIINNSGIDINSSKGSRVNAIFSGRVSKVIMIMNKYAVIIQHGEYFTVYSNLKEVFVKSGDEVTTKQALGIVQTDEEGKSEVHLEIWKGSSKMNPESWLASK